MLTIDTCWKRVGIWGDRSCPELATHLHCRNCGVFCSAAAALLDRKPPEGYQAEWTMRIAQPRHKELAGTLSIVIFRVGGEWLALPSKVFLEVADLRPIRSLPHRRQDDAVRGVVNIRGELLLCVSPAGLLGLVEQGLPPEPKKERKAHPRLLVLSHKGNRAVFPVDEVHVGRRYHPDELKPVPSTVSLASAAYTLGLISWEGFSVGILDSDLLFYTLGRQFA